MKKKDFVCPNCGSKRVYPVPKANRIMVRCADCDSFVAFTNYSVIQEMYKNLKNEDLPENVAFKKVYRRNGVTNMKCSKCKCPLYDSRYPRPQGQFDLSEAYYCPRCGRKLI